MEGDAGPPKPLNPGPFELKPCLGFKVSLLGRPLGHLIFSFIELQRVFFEDCLAEALRTV